MLSEEEKKMEEIAERIANFDLPNPILVEFFKQVLHDPSILQKDKALSCLLTIAEKLCLPRLISQETRLISQESYKEALQKMEEMGIDLYVQEVNLLIEEIGQEKVFEFVSLIAWTMFGSEEEEKRRVQEYFGVLLCMVRLERQKEKTTK